MIQQVEISLPRFNRGCHLITSRVIDKIPELPEKGLLNIFIKHTSAGLTMNENADPSVLQDFNEIFNRLVPEDEPYYTHLTEGSDDMPAHFKTSLIGNSLTIPIKNHTLNVGTWQGIYLCEFRDSGRPRNLSVSIYS